MMYICIFCLIPGRKVYTCGSDNGEMVALTRRGKIRRRKAMKKCFNIYVDKNTVFRLSQNGYGYRKPGAKQMMGTINGLTFLFIYDW